MGITSALFYVLFMFSLYLGLEKVCGNAELEDVLSCDSFVPSTTCQSSILQGNGREYGVELIPSRGPCSPLHGLSSDELKKPRVPVELDSYYQYLVPVEIGEPKHRLKLIMDTGSGITWTQCKPCLRKKCKFYPQKDTYFYSNMSATFSLVSNDTKFCQENDNTDPPHLCKYSIQYLDGSYSSGYYAHDTLVIESARIQDFAFGCGQNDSKKFYMADGILGLAVGNDNNTFLSQTSLPHLKNDFCYCLPSKDSSPGYLLFGDDARMRCRTETLTPIVDPSKYIINLTGITVGNETIIIPKSDNQKILIDSGTTITRLQPGVYSDLQSKFKTYMAKNNLAAPVSHDFLDTCYLCHGRQSFTIPKITLHFDQADVTLDPGGIMTRDKKDNICLAFASIKDNGNMILGNVQMRKLDVLFDLNSRKIGFKKGSCGN